ncbi:MAG: carboxypeptidase-like regulatory domain-containing protein [Gemmatimonadales bacterium]
MSSTPQLRRRLARLAISGCALVCLSRSARAQTVVEVQGGGSSLMGGYGTTANFWRPGVDGWIGIGYLNGFRAGAFLRKSLSHDTLGIGNTALVMRLPTDIFISGYNLLVQGVSYTGGNDRTSYLGFGGASSAGIGAPSFQPTNIEQPMGALFLQHRAAPTVRVTLSSIFAEKQTVLPGLQWQPTPDVTAGFVAGVGSGRPYGASSLSWRQGPLELKAAYAWNPDRFRRAAVPTPNQAEVDRENVAITYELNPQFSIGVARQNFVQDSSDSSLPVRATGNTIFAGGRIREVRLSAGVYDSRSQGTANLSSYFALGRELAHWLDAEVFLLQSRPERQPATTTPLVNLRWRLSPRLGLSQQISFHDHRPTVLFGANLVTSIGEFAVDYQIVHQPFKPLNPFRSALNLTARLQLGSYSTSLGTYVRPDGAVDYSASGSTFLYLGAFGGAQPQQIGGRISQYVIRGNVRDETGNPVEGAALDFNGELVFTNSSGEFLLRSRRPSRYALTVQLPEFLLPGVWEVMSAPTDVTASEEGRAVPIQIILRHPEAGQ